ncbi:hypothetical protein PAMA_014254 [Pampus argenteus]
MGEKLSVQEGVEQTVEVLQTMSVGMLFLLSQILVHDFHSRREGQRKEEWHSHSRNFQVYVRKKEADRKGL